MRWFRTESGLVARQLGREDFQVPNYEEYRLEIVNEGPQNMNGIVNFAKIGNLVVYTAEDLITHNSASSVQSVSAIPERFRPKNRLAINCYYFTDFGLNSYIETNGTVVIIYRDENGAAVNQGSSAQKINGSYLVL